MLRKTLPLVVYTLLLVPVSISAQKKPGTTARKNVIYREYSKPISLKDDPAPVKNLKFQFDSNQIKPRRFYINQINDSTNSNDSIGYVLQPKSGKRQKLAFEGGTKNFFQNCFDKKLKKDSSLIPLIFNISKFDITDERATPYDNTLIKYRYEFLYPYKNKLERIASYTGEGSLYTPIGMKKKFDSIILTGLDRQFSSLDDMLDEMTEKSPMFCKGVKLTATLRSDENLDTIFYNSNRNLDWEDFQGDSRNANNTFGSYMGLSCDLEKYDYKNNYYNLNVNVGASFIKSESWIGRDVRQMSILTHMDYRLKLTNLHAKQLKKKIEQTVFSCDNFNTELRNLYTQAYKDLNIDLQQFDKETRYGQSRKEEKAWQKTIDAETDQLSQ